MKHRIASTTLVIVTLLAGFVGAGLSANAQAPPPGVNAQATTGSARAWGKNDLAQLGTGGNNDASLPVQVSGLTDGVVAVVGGTAGDHALALMSDGTIMSWGFNNQGQLGRGFVSTNACKCESTPGPVVSPTGSGKLTNIVAVAAGGGMAFALKSDGTVWSWGDNRVGELGRDPSAFGNGAPEDPVPGQVKDPTDPTGNLTGITAISGGGGHEMALKNNTTIRTWGLNNFGQLGDGTPPVLVAAARGAP